MIRRGRLTNEERERGFQLNAAPAPLPTYDALRDNNLRQYFESKTVQKFLQSSGWIDKEGRIVDLDKFRSVPAPPATRAWPAVAAPPPAPAWAHAAGAGRGHSARLRPPRLERAAAVLRAHAQLPPRVRQEQAEHYRARVQVRRKDRVLEAKGGGGDATNNSSKAGARPAGL